MSELVVTAPARLHLGMLDALGIGPRRFGGVGVGVTWPRVVVAVHATEADVRASGPQSDRAAEFAQRAARAFSLSGGVAVQVREAIPSHRGLGSGTKLGLAVAAGVAALAGRRPAPPQLAAASGRGARSSVGCWTFVEPGLVVEAGVARDAELSPLVARCPMPADWRCVLAVPADAQGLSGDAEAHFFAGDGPGASPTLEPSVSRLVLTGLLPGLAGEDLDEFGAALSAIQDEVGGMFAERQGGVFHPRAAPLVTGLRRLGVTAVGQSSWGPAAYGIVDSPQRAQAVATGLRAEAGPDVAIEVVDFDRLGATVRAADEVAA